MKMYDALKGKDKQKHTKFIQPNTSTFTFTYSHIAQALQNLIQLVEIY